MNEMVSRETEIISGGEITREQLLAFQEILRGVPGAVEGKALDEVCPLIHKHAPGIYVREIFIPKGFFIVGKIHKHAHPNVLMSGDVSVVTEEGQKRLKAPLSMISPAGTKRIVYAHEDTRWVTFHATDETDLEKIEQHVIAPTFEEYDQFKLTAEKPKEITT